MATITVGTDEQAKFLAAMPQLVGNGHLVLVDGHAVTLSATALDRLADLPDDHDGHFDGLHVWIGGTRYPVTR